MTDDIPDGGFAPVVEALIDWKNERFLKDLSQDLKRGLRDLAADGYAPGGFPPRGYLAELGLSTCVAARSGKAGSPARVGRSAPGDRK